MSDIVDENETIMRAYARFLQGDRDFHIEHFRMLGTYEKIMQGAKELSAEILDKAFDLCKEFRDVSKLINTGVRI